MITVKKQNYTGGFKMTTENMHKTLFKDAWLYRLGIIVMIFGFGLISLFSLIFGIIVGAYGVFMALSWFIVEGKNKWGE